jgi:phenylalanyl-tRNA synthetase beta chain
LVKKLFISNWLTPINNIVDITNFVLHDLGQPLHAFDLNKITGNKIIVKTGLEGTKFKTLDGTERTLLANDLMICN